MLYSQTVLSRNMKVTVALVTYNSSKTVIETLESILNQSYGSSKIELIISDDASKDETVSLIKEWLLQNERNFFSVTLVEHKCNIGVSANFNSAWKCATSEWIKSIGGDDILDERCIDINLSYINSHPSCDILFSKMKWFGNISKITPDPYQEKFFELSVDEQLRYFKYKSFNIAPTSFIRLSKLKTIGYADESYKNNEDYPLWLSYLKSGCKLHYIPFVTVFYRVSTSISKSDVRYVNLHFLDELIRINIDNKPSFLKEPFSYLEMLEQRVGYTLKFYIARVCGNKISKLSKVLDILCLFLKPIYIFETIKRRCYNASRVNRGGDS